MKLTDKIELFNEDNMTGMARYPDKHFDLAIVDPPYGIGVETHTRNARPTKKWANPSDYNYKVFDDSKPPDEEYFNELKRVSINQIIWGGNYFTSYLPPSMGWVVWDKKVDEKEHISMVEMAWTSFKRKAMKFELLWAGFKKGEQIKRIHPTQKPVALYKWLLEKYAKPDFKILDTHAGSFSIGIAAHKYGCHLTGFEIDPEYHAAAVHRFKMQTSPEYAIAHKVQNTGQTDLFFNAPAELKTR